MPEGTKIISAISSGVSAWARTAKVAVNQPDGSRKNYFLKVQCMSLTWVRVLLQLLISTGRFRLERQSHL